MNHIKRFAEQKDITLRELAEKIGVSDIRMIKIANDQRPVGPIEALNLLLFFDCKPSELFGEQILIR